MSDNNELILKTFISGTKAKADEVNSNFSILKNALVSKADVSGNSLQPFFVANAEDDMQAVNKGQVEALQEEMKVNIQKMSSFFCAKSGNVTDGNADLFDFSELTITPKVGGAYPDLVCSDYEGNSYTFDSFADLSMAGKADGTYNIFVNSEGNLYVKNNTIYIQKSTPQMLEEDIWLDTSVEPIICKKYINQEYENFHDIPLGKVCIESGAISKIETFSYNQNGYSMNSNSNINYYYDYASPVSLAYNAHHTMTSDGLLYVYGNDYNSTSYIYLDGQCYTFSFAVSLQARNGFIFPVTRGQTVYTEIRYEMAMMFIPLKFRKEILCI